MVAGEILGVDREVITGMDKDLPIRRVKDIEVTSDDDDELTMLAEQIAENQYYQNTRK